jgi:hypothetical protein
MQDRIFGDREKAMEDSYFRERDAKLLAQLRQMANLDDIAVALGRKLEVDNPELLQRVRDAGITLETAAALFLAPLVQVAWAGGSVTRAEHDAVLRLARQRGVETDSPAYAQLERWLEERPDDTLFVTAVEVIKSGFSVLPQEEKEARTKYVVDACHEVAEASGSTLGWVLGISSLSHSEAAALDTIANTLRRPGSRG